MLDNQTIERLDASTGAAAAANDRLSGDFRRGAARGTIINAIFLVGVNALGLMKGFIVAAFLTRAEYGVWGVLLITLGTLLFLKHVGIGQRYVQQDEPDQRLAFQRAFTLELIVSLAAWALLIAAVPVAAVAYGEPRLLAPGLVLTLMVPAQALQMPAWIFYRRMDFRRQRLVQAVDPVVGFAVTVGLAIAGLGYWSLVVGVVAGSWVGAAVAVAASPHPPAIRLDRGAARAYFSFSWPLVGASVSGILIAQLSVFVSEATLGLAGAGIVVLASSIAVYADKLDQIVTQTLYPAICAVRDRTDLLFESFTKSNRLALMWGVPFGVGVALFAEPLVEHGIGDHWAPAIGLIQAFGLIAAANHIGFNWGAFYTARGDTRPLAVNGGLALLAFVAVALPLLVAEGTAGFGAGMAVVTAVALATRGYYLTRLFPAFGMLRHCARGIAPTVPAAAAVLAVRALPGGGGGAAQALAELALYGAVTAAATLLLERALLREVAGYLRRAPARTSVPAPSG